MGISPDHPAIVAATRKGLVIPGPVAMPPAGAPPPDCSEEEFTRLFIAHARSRGWLAAHFRPGLTRRGRWVTAVQGDGRGLPDVLLVRERVAFAELKAAAGRLAPAQREWADRLRAAGADVRLWRPADWPEVVEWLA